MSEAEADHHCPGCGQALPVSERYPWYFCQACLRRAEGAQGRRLAFFNADISGGLCWCYADRADGFAGGRMSAA